MSDPSLSSYVLRRPGQWPKWLGFICLSLAVSPFLYRSIKNWQTESAIRDTVTGFFAEVARGDKESALTYLSDEYRSAVLSASAVDQDKPWEKSEQLPLSIRKIEVRSDMAEVDLVLSKSGFVLKPKVHLCCLPDHSWRIAKIDGIETDPHWTKFQEQQEQEKNEDLYQDLADQLTGPSSQ